MNGNPFYVEPFGGYGKEIVQGLSGLGSVLGQQQQIKKQKAIQDQAKQLFAAGDPGKIAEFSLQYPEMAQQVSTAIKFKNDQTKQNMLDSMRRIIGGEDPRRVILERAQMVQAQGGDPIDTLNELAVYDENPQAYPSIVANAYAALDPRGFLEYRQATGQAERQAPFQQGTGPLAGYVFNPASGEYVPAFPEGQMPKKDNRTATQRDFEYIQELRDRGMGVEADALQKKLLKTGDPVADSAEATFQKENVLSTFDRSLDAIDSIVKHPALDSNVYWRAATSKLPATNAREFEGMVKTLTSQAFLNEIEKMKGLGALSESEGNKVASAVANLDTLQDNKALRNQLNIAANIFKSGRARAEKKYSTLESQAQKKAGSLGQGPSQEMPKFSNNAFAEAAKRASAKEGRTVTVEEFKKRLGM